MSMVLLLARSVTSAVTTSTWTLSPAPI
jgi:hypothetical protein